jgi:hypothetical protein
VSRNLLGLQDLIYPPNNNQRIVTTHHFRHHQLKHNEHITILHRLIQPNERLLGEKYELEEGGGNPYTKRVVASKKKKKGGKRDDTLLKNWTHIAVSKRKQTGSTALRFNQRSKQE